MTRKADSAAEAARSRERLQVAVGSDFRVSGLIGRGGYAEVFEAHDEKLGRRVAIKVLRPDLPVSDRLVDRLQLEARAIAGLRHPNVMEIYTVGERDGVAYFVMPFVDGESLGQRLEREGRLEVAEARRILVDAASALEAAHRAGTVHRDVKPDNILLEGEDARVLLADFGIAKALGEETGSLTRSGVFVGTPKYMSPEQASGDRLDHRSDIYSLGIVAFEMIAGEAPFTARSVQALIAKQLTQPPPSLTAARPDCPEGLDRVIARCLSKDPGDRWESLADMLTALERERVAPPAPGRGSAAVRSGEAAGGGRAVDVEHGEGPDAESERGRDPVEADSGDVRLRAFRRSAALAGAVVAVLLAADLTLGLAGVSAWVAVGTIMYIAARAGRLWTAGYEWTELLLPWNRAYTGSSAGGGDVPSGRPHAEDFGRFGSLVRTCTADRATIVRAFGQLPHQEQKRFPTLRGTVEALAGRVRHLARKVGTLEERIAEAAARAEASDGAVADAELVDASFERHAARLQELNAARDAAARELRSCVGYLEVLSDTVTDRARLDPSRAMEELSRTLTEAAEHLGGRDV